MPTPKIYREAIRSALVCPAGNAPNAVAVAEATIRIWQHANAQLIPVIGAGGFDVLFNRSLHLTCCAFPWLTILGDKRDRTLLLAHIKTLLAGQETDVAVEASYTLLVTFFEILTTLIGESLAESLLGPVWVFPSPTSAQENES